MLATQSGIANYHCLFTRGAVAFQTPGVVVYSPGTCITILYHFYAKIINKVLIIIIDNTNNLVVHDELLIARSILNSDDRYNR